MSHLACWVCHIVCPTVCLVPRRRVSAGKQGARGDRAPIPQRYAQHHTIRGTPGDEVGHTVLWQQCTFYQNFSQATVWKNNTTSKNIHGSVTPDYLQWINSQVQIEILLAFIGSCRPPHREQDSYFSGLHVTRSIHFLKWKKMFHD